MKRRNFLKSIGGVAVASGVGVKASDEMPICGLCGAKKRHVHCRYTGTYIVCINDDCGELKELHSRKGVGSDLFILPDKDSAFVEKWMNRRR